uniref:Uncharacterized protein n=1 Tax=Steinernema glaseri TaxID=37863 RepID=A0A1I7YHG9_9BILA
MALLSLEKDISMENAAE